MTPLIEIKTVPIEIEMKISHAELKHAQGTADLEIRKKPNGMQVRSKSIQINMDSFQSHDVVLPHVTSVSNSSANQSSTYQATASYNQHSNELLMNAKINQELLPKFSQQHIEIASESAPSPVQDSPEAQMNIRFEMEKLNYDMRINSQELEFTPGDIEFTVAQRPEVIITYTGGPLYVPPSADPDYEPIDVQA